MASTLLLNFYAVELPEAALPFHTRPLALGERLRHDELGWRPDGRFTPGPPTRAVFVGATPPQQKYGTESVNPAHAMPGVIKALLQVALQARLQDGGRQVEPGHLGIVAFRPNERIADGIPNFIECRRGVDFRADHFTPEGRRLYGFFVSPEVRLRFARPISADSVLARAAHGQMVRVVDEAGSVTARVRSIDSSTGTAVVEHDGSERTVSLGQVHAPVSAHILSEYCRLIGRHREASAIRRAVQAASYRLRPNGQRNRRWIVEQSEYVRNWFGGLARYDRLDLTWAGGSQTLHLTLRPMDVVEAVG